MNTTKYELVSNVCFNDDKSVIKNFLVDGACPGDPQNIFGKIHNQYFSGSSLYFF